ncbi:MAG: hypothetical protein Q4B57_06050 [Eubacteriales bacterium]|nr:hypothetical protein [Eubacteriales bacterium]
MEFRYMVLLLYLAAAAVRDVRHRSVSVKSAVLFAAAAMLLQFIGGSTRGVDHGWQERMLLYGVWIITGALPGLTLLVLAWVTGESIGYGDGIVLLVTGWYLGWYGSIGVLLMGLLLICPAALWMLFWKKADRRAELPFLPFLLGGYLIWLPGMMK